MDFIDSVVDLFVRNATLDIPTQKKKRKKIRLMYIIDASCSVQCDIHPLNLTETVKQI